MSNRYAICPSILSADLACLGAEVSAVLAAGADRIHIDVMDNHYVPNLTFGPIICRALRDHGIVAPLDIHLMVEPVDALIVDFAGAGATSIVFHPEASRHVDRSLNLIAQHGCQAGLAINPATSLSCLDYTLEYCDRLLLMSVNPGFSSQSFIGHMVDKIAATRQLITDAGKSTVLEVDGGVKVANIKKLAQAGADAFVAGSAIFGQTDYQSVIAAMRRQLADAA